MSEIGRAYKKKLKLQHCRNIKELAKGKTSLRKIIKIVGQKLKGNPQSDRNPSKKAQKFMRVSYEKINIKWKF